jgi:hypothetical protein
MKVLCVSTSTIRVVIVTYVSLLEFSAVAVSTIEILERHFVTTFRKLPFTKQNDKIGNLFVEEKVLVVFDDSFY